MTVKRMDNVGIVVENLDAAIEFFTEFGLELEGCAPVNALGYLRAMFTVEDIDDTLTRLVKRGAKLAGEVVQYDDMYRLCYIRGPEVILIGFAQQLEQQTSRADPMRRKR